MKNSQKTIFFSTIIVLVLGLVSYFVFQGNGPTNKVNYDSFATCAKDKGAVFYGAFWCIHCNNTKDFFGSSKNLLPYVECSTPDSESQTPICKDKGIEGYPTWEFADGSRITGEITEKNPDNLYKIAEKTSCELPVGAPALPIKTEVPATPKAAQ
jgi:hypothetical protein